MVQVCWGSGPLAGWVGELPPVSSPVGLRQPNRVIFNDMERTVLSLKSLYKVLGETGNILPCPISYGLSFYSLYLKLIAFLQRCAPQCFLQRSLFWWDLFGHQQHSQCAMMRWHTTYSFVLLPLILSSFGSFSHTYTYFPQSLHILGLKKMFFPL